MKTKLITLLTLVLLAFTVNGRQLIDLGTGTIFDGEASTTPNFTVQENDGSIVVTYDFAYAHVISEEGKTSQGIEVDDFGVSYTPGEPALLIKNDMVNISKMQNVTVSLVSSDYVDIPFELSPAKRMLYGNESNDEIVPITPYAGFSQNKLIEASEAYVIRGQKYIDVTVSPISYDYLNKVVRFYRSITYKVESNSKGLFKAPSQTSTNDNASIAYESISINDPSFAPKVEPEGMIIVTSDELYDEAYKYALNKTKLGFNVYLKKYPKGTTTATIKNDIRNYISQDSTIGYLFIIGDQNHVPAFNRSLNYYVENLKHSETCHYLTDLYYVAYEDDEEAPHSAWDPNKKYLPQIARGRIPVKDVSEARIVLDKIRDYEFNPPTQNHFYSDALLMSCYEIKKEAFRVMVGGDTIINHHYVNKEDDHRFVEFTEKVRNRLESCNKNVQRIYTYEPKNARDIWGTIVTPLRWNNGDSIPVELRNTSFYGAIGETEALNKGKNIVLYQAHGNVSNQGCVWYEINHVNKLKNGNLQPVYFALSCYMGAYDKAFTDYIDPYEKEDSLKHKTYGECFTRALLVNPNGGAVGAIAATSLAWTVPHLYMSQGIFEAMTSPANEFDKDNGFYRMGDILDYALLYAREKTNGDLMHNTFEYFHYFGDPTMEIHYNKPEPIKDFVASIVQDDSGSYYLTATSDNADSYSIINTTNPTLKPIRIKGEIMQMPFADIQNNEYEIWAYGKNKIPSRVKLGLNNTQEEFSDIVFSVAKNPLQNKVNVGYSIPKTYSTYQIGIYTLMGRPLYKTKSEKPTGTMTMKTLEYNLSGTFIVALFVDGKLVKSQQVKI